MSEQKERLEKIAAHHEQEAQRLQSELAGLGPEYAQDGIVRYVLRQRIAQEERWARAAMKQRQKLTTESMGP